MHFGNKVDVNVIRLLKRQGTFCGIFVGLLRVWEILDRGRVGHRVSDLYSSFVFGCLASTSINGTRSRKVVILALCYLYCLQNDIVSKLAGGRTHWNSIGDMINLGPFTIARNHSGNCSDIQVTLWCKFSFLFNTDYLRQKFKQKGIINSTS